MIKFNLDKNGIKKKLKKLKKLKIKILNEIWNILFNHYIKDINIIIIIIIKLTNKSNNKK